MAEPTPKPKEDIIIRTMKGDLAGPAPKLNRSSDTKGQGPLQQKVISALGREAEYNPPQTPQAPATPAPAILTPPPSPKVETTPPVQPAKPPILIVPPKTISPKENLETPPLYKTKPVWTKLAVVGLVIIFLTLSGLYGYWKIFVQSKLPTAVNLPTATTTEPTLPIAPAATTTAPIKFFSKLPNKSITIDLPSKTPTALIQALKYEAKIEETIASIKQIKITSRGELITVKDFFDLMSIFAPKDFLSNYEDEFALAYFNQKEGARPILILSVKDKELAQNQMANWEKATLASDIFPLFLSDFKPPKSSQAFKSYLFVGQLVRYLNIGISYASLNYAIYNNFLVFTTSSAGMFVVLQDLTGQTVSQSYLDNLKASINEFIK